MTDPLIEIAEDALRYWGGIDLTRESAVALLPTWRHAGALTDGLRTEVLARFPLGEPVMVPSVDFLPEQVAPAGHFEVSAGPLVGCWAVICNCGDRFIGPTHDRASSVLTAHATRAKGQVPA